LLQPNVGFLKLIQVCIGLAMGLSKRYIFICMRRSNSNWWPAPKAWQV